ncbi:MAG: N4-gp56 family major capsid protein [Victivallaceae bacterium]
MAYVTTTVIGPAVKEKFNRMLLKRVQPYLTAHYFAYKYTMPMNSGDTMVMRRYGTLPASVVPLTEGAPGTETPVSVNDIKVLIKQYGSFQRVSDWSQYITQENVANELAYSFSLQMGITLNKLYFDLLNTCASVMYASGGVISASAATPGYVTEKDVRLGVSLIHSGNARPLTTAVQGRDAYYTFPIRPAYWGLGHSDILSYDLQKIPSFIASANYPNNNVVISGMEVGAVLDTRWMTSTEGIKITTGSLSGVTGAATATTTDPHYALFITGDQAYGGVQLGRDIVKVSEERIEWQMLWGGAILNDRWMIKMICRNSYNFTPAP